MIVLPRRRLARLLLALVALLGMLGAVEPALAHGLATRSDLPIPAWLFGWTAAMVLVVTFIALAGGWSRPRLERSPRRALPDRLGRALTSRPVRIGCGVIGVFLLAIVVWAGLMGTQITHRNLAPTFVYIVFILGLVPLSVLFGDVFRAFNPWLAIGRAASWLTQRARSATCQRRRRTRKGWGTCPLRQASSRSPGSS